MDAMHDTGKKPKAQTAARLKEVVTGKRDGMTAREAIIELARKGGADHLPFFRQVAKDLKQPARVRMTALRQLSAFGGVSAEKDLSPFLTDKDPAIQTGVIRELRWKGGQGTAKALSTFRTTNSRLRGEVLLAQALIANRTGSAGFDLAKSAGKLTNVRPASGADIQVASVPQSERSIVADAIRSLPGFRAANSLVCGSDHFVICTKGGDAAEGVVLEAVLLKREECPDMYEQVMYFFSAPADGKTRQVFGLDSRGGIVYSGKMESGAGRGKFNVTTTTLAMRKRRAVEVCGSMTGGEIRFESAVSGLGEELQLRAVRVPKKALPVSATLRPPSVKRRSGRK